MITTILAALAATVQPAPAPAPAPSHDHHKGMEHGEKGCACCKDMAKPMACCAKGDQPKPAQHDGHSAH